MMPFLPFTWGNASRYLYLPAMGFGMLLAEGVEWVDRTLAGAPAPGVAPGNRRVPHRRRVDSLLGVRAEGVTNFSARTEVYRRYGQKVRDEHPQLAPDSTVFIDPRDETVLKHRYLEGLIRWEYRDPTIRVVTREVQVTRDASRERLLRLAPAPTTPGPASRRCARHPSARARR